MRLALVLVLMGLAGRSFGDGIKDALLKSVSTPQWASPASCAPVLPSFYSGVWLGAESGTLELRSFSSLDAHAAQLSVALDALQATWLDLFPEPVRQTLDALYRTDKYAVPLESFASGEFIQLGIDRKSHPCFKFGCPMLAIHPDYLNAPLSLRLIRLEEMLRYGLRVAKEAQGQSRPVLTEEAKKRQQEKRVLFLHVLNQQLLRAIPMQILEYEFRTKIPDGPAKNSLWNDFVGRYRNSLPLPPSWD